MPEPRGPRGPLAPPPIFGRSFNPIPTGEGSLSPPIANGPLNVFHLPASLLREYCEEKILVWVFPNHPSQKLVKSKLDN